ncbi:restriction endonuclease subunit S [Aeromonas veronii]|uniref:restriction endonuclease subunit S n=1 Tax=Aeromonas veronii TaxID=654 RepID=UPI003B9ECE9E
MSDKYLAYPEYKESGVEWLGRIPKNWIISKVRYLTECLDGQRVPLNAEQRGEIPGNYPYWGANGVVDYVGKWLFDEDLVLIGEDGAPFFDTNKDVAFNVSDKIWVNNHAHILRPKRGSVCGTFLKYALNRVDFHLYINGSTRDKLTQADLNNISLRLPSVEEQRTIAAFLDYETARIDRLIAQQQRLIELLKEKRQAVISHAVTKGLNPNAPMKDSGVEWIGQVPEHWGVSALGYYSMLNTGATPDRSKNQYWGGTIPWIKTGEVRYDTIYETEETITQAALSETSVRLSKPGTLLMAMYGQGITRGRVAILGVSATYNQACVAITPNSKLTNDFLKFFFMAGYDALRDGGNETSQMNLNADIVSKFKVLVPSYEEQIDIVSFLRIKLAHYEQLINKSEHAIALMQERRTALISAAVTGKIDLRGWEPPAEEAAA